MTRANIETGGWLPSSEDSEFQPCCSPRVAVSGAAGHMDCEISNSCFGCPRSVKWLWSSFDDLTAPMLHAALRLRQDIFIVEQNVPYADIDGRDLQSMHLMGLLDGELIAYLRALPCGLFEPGYSSFGRVVVHEKMRGFGLGRKLIELCLGRVETEHGRTPVKISSQLYLKDFYSSFDFLPVGEPYIEDRIPHIAMVRA